MKKYILLTLLSLTLLFACNPNDALLSNDQTGGVTVFSYVASFNKDGRLIATTPTTTIRNFDVAKQAIEHTFEVADLEEGDFFKVFASFDGKEYSEKMLLFGDPNQALYKLKVNL